MRLCETSKPVWENDFGYFLLPLIQPCLVFDCHLTFLAGKLCANISMILYFWLFELFFPLLLLYITVLKILCYSFSIFTMWIFFLLLVFPLLRYSVLIFALLVLQTNTPNYLHFFLILILIARINMKENFKTNWSSDESILNLNLV